MSIGGEKMEAEEIKDALERLFAGREPREGWLARCPTINPWRIRVLTVGAKREIVIEGTLTSGRFKVKQQPKWPIQVLWMDRKRRFALTARGMRNLGEEEREVDMDFTVPGEGER
jgi:hypothetical protein